MAYPIETGYYKDIKVEELEKIKFPSLNERMYLRDFILGM